MTVIFASYAVQAQIINPKDKIKNKTTTKTNQKIDEGIDAGIGAIEDGIGSIFKKKDKKEKTKNQKTSNTKTPNGNSNSSSDGDDTDFSEYEGSAFVPGKDVLYFDNFSNSNLNDGPGNWWTITSDEKLGPSIVTLSGSSDKWLRTMEEGYYLPNDLGALPTDVTVEFDAYADNDELSENFRGFEFQFFGDINRKQLITETGVFSFMVDDHPKVIVDVHPHPKKNGGGIGVTNFAIEKRDPQGNRTGLADDPIGEVWKVGEVNHIAIARKGNGLQVFVNGKEYFNQSNVFDSGITYYPLFRSHQWYEYTGMYITNFRVGTNTPNATNDLQKDGMFVTSAIYFDTASSRIKPESWATLNNAAQAIKSTSGTIMITGHTDSDGSDETNLILSQKRAASVKNVLVNDFGIDASRLLTDGKGEAQPVADNSTAAGKAKNRRVEFVKQ